MFHHFMGKLVTSNNLFYLLLLPIQFNEPMNFHLVDLSTLETKVSNKMSSIAKQQTHMTFNILMKRIVRTMYEINFEYHRKIIYIHLLCIYF